jgi:hypothetical protein
MAGGRKNQGGPDMRVDLAPFNPIGTHQQDASLATVQTISPPGFGSTASQVDRIIVQAFDQNIRYTLDGSDPTTTFGFRLTATNDPILIPIGPNTILKFVEEGATAILSYVWGE